MAVALSSWMQPVTLFLTMTEAIIEVLIEK